MNTKSFKLVKREVIKAPHPILQDALFMYATFSDGVDAVQIRGWTALVKRIEEEVGGDDWAQEALSDLDDWQENAIGEPTLYERRLDEFCVYRVTAPKGEEGKNG
ncbi:hypothetical protein [Variovorax sp. tm]|uniref:hypothetical protein n=1 Tax=Variovorax atrisoli TaxID=3394203 RepID=UPI003A8033A3